MRKQLYVPLSLLVFLFFIAGACRNRKAVAPTEMVQRDTSITTANAFTELFFDSTDLSNFVLRQKVQDSIAGQLYRFYSSRNYQYAWFNADSTGEQLTGFLNLLDNYNAYSGDSSLRNPELDSLLQLITAEHYKTNRHDSVRLQTELLLTAQFFRYADKAYAGNSAINEKDLGWFIPRKKVNMVGVLDSLIANKGQKINDYEPVNQQYHKLKKYLTQYYEIEKTGGWSIINSRKKRFVYGDTDSVIRSVKKRLLLTGDLASKDTGALFTHELEQAVKNYQHRYGFKEDGIISATVIKEMNRPVSQRIQQMLINMERLRWVPAMPPDDYLLVNIPEFILHVFAKGKQVFKMDVVVGSQQHNSVIFTGKLKYIVFSPYWNVPVSIVKKEIVPGIKKNPHYIKNHNMEITGYSGSLPIVRQKPGVHNSLGLVKFLFPNSYDIYFHDTPSKSLFSESKRAFSHGCIRLGEPAKLAQYLLKDNAEWTEGAIKKAMNSGKEKYVIVKPELPVFIGYFTAWVDSGGLLNFRDDVYGHDAAMADKMFTAQGN